MLDERVLFEDMVDMECLNDAELCENLRIRYEQDEIFTYVGLTLLVVNPYRKIDRLYSQEILQEYQAQAYNPDFSLNQKAPHNYAIAAMTFKDLKLTMKKQAICISGESGAGKTVNTKDCMAFLTQL